MKVKIEFCIIGVYAGEMEDKENPGKVIKYWQAFDENDKVYKIDEYIYNCLKAKKEIKLDLPDKTKLVCPDYKKPRSFERI